MTLSVTNTLSGEREPFESIEPGVVRLYFCGLTVSDYPHLGHARSWVHVDVMRRWMEQSGYDVRYVENFTDVNEKIVARIDENDFGGSESAVARYFMEVVLRDMRALNLKRAVAYPRVSEHIPEIISLIERLIEAGYAYESDGSVYFDVTTFEQYGALSNQHLDEIETQGDPDERDEKRHPADFALWKHGGVGPADAAEHRSPELPPLESERGTTWSSPWGDGRPGWHIECSAMSMTHLADQIDIHVGGQDLVFPHHENEIAQSEAASGQRFAKYWLHVRLLETGGEKMSSSLQNYFTVHNAIDEFGMNPIRMFLLSTQYSQPQAYTEDALHEAVERWHRLSRGYSRAMHAADSVDATTKHTDDALRETTRTVRSRFRESMNDDFNTREALSALFELVTAVNRHLDERTEYDYPALYSVITTLEVFGQTVLGFEFQHDRPSEPSDTLDELIELVLDIRESERTAGNYDRADELRAALESLGITVEDSADGTSYSIDRSPNT